MGAKFSKLTNGIYPLSVYKTFPIDAADIPDELYQKFVSGEINDNSFDIVNGVVVSVAPPAPTIEEKRRLLKCTAYQIRQALTIAGLRDQVESAVAVGDQSLKDAWNHLQNFERLHPKIIELGVSLGQTDQQLDDLFSLGMTLQP